MFETEPTGSQSTAIESALESVFIEFDAFIGKEATDIFAGKHYTEWTERDVWDVLRPDPETFAKGRRAVVGSTALVGFLSKDRKDLWTACAGDSQACKAHSAVFIDTRDSDTKRTVLVVGRMQDGRWSAKCLSESHNVKNPTELARLREEHPGEELVKYYRLLGLITVTRGKDPVMLSLILELKV